LYEGSKKLPNAVRSQLCLTVKELHWGRSSGGKVHVWLYRVIKKSLCIWWLQYRKLQVMFRVSPGSLQTFIDTPNCVLEDPNSNYVIMVGDW